MHDEPGASPDAAKSGGNARSHRAKNNYYSANRVPISSKQGTLSPKIITGRTFLFSKYFRLQVTGLVGGGINFHYRLQGRRRPELISLQVTVFSVWGINSETIFGEGVKTFTKPTTRMFLFTLFKG